MGNSDYRDCPGLQHTGSLEEWLPAYQALTRYTGDTAMADSTRLGILADLKTIDQQQPGLFGCLQDPMEFSEHLDAYIDKFFVPSMVKRIRSVR